MRPLNQLRTLTPDVPRRCSPRWASLPSFRAKQVPLHLRTIIPLKCENESGAFPKRALFHTSAMRALAGRQAAPVHSGQNSHQVGEFSPLCTVAALRSSPSPPRPPEPLLRPFSTTDRRTYEPAPPALPGISQPAPRTAPESETRKQVGRFFGFSQNALPTRRGAQLLRNRRSWANASGRGFGADASGRMLRGGRFRTSTFSRLTLHCTRRRG